ncbi:hypothetical protein DYB32_009774 [Aphanomyces invadans]|uniref:DDE-1 domain-containing protein n=1 Tax=Aphanomyces invadans TaxID=157072 RepID=A0A3R7CTP7_9STRA|nr:hypothetical protein DYB32_009774 [Aphanomyces invadans]
MHAKRVITDLESTRIEFAREFHLKHGGYLDDCVYNVDETGIQFDMPPRYIWSRKRSSPKLTTEEKHSYRMTAHQYLRFVTEGVEAAAEVGYEVCPLPTNATSHCQLLVVSILAPFKKYLRDLWIAEDMVSTPDGDDEEYWKSPASRVKRTTMIKRAILAWERITPDQTRASFLKAITQ